MSITLPLSIVLEHAFHTKITCANFSRMLIRSHMNLPRVRDGKYNIIIGSAMASADLLNLNPLEHNNNYIIMYAPEH